jgi:flagellar biosynthetic protein FliP
MTEVAPLSLPLQVVVLMTLLSVLPGALLMMTAFTRIVIVLAILRQALGLTQMPPNPVLIGMALLLTAFVMQPTVDLVTTQALDPYMKGALALEPALAITRDALKDFMMAHVRTEDVRAFAEMAKVPQPRDLADLPLTVLMPAFVAGELRAAFQIGFLIFLPFLVIDLLVASVLMAMGMVMMSPNVVSTPLKLLLFVAIDGWTLVMGSLAGSFQP